MTTKTPSLEVPKHKEALLDSYKEKEVKETSLTPENFQESALDQLPNPTGYRILVPIQMTSVCGYVLKMGDLCYKDEKKFPNGPWCKPKEWVMFGRYAGARFKIEGGEIRILNDDEIISTIKNPESILQLY